jgi:hypothetical protein
LAKVDCLAARLFKADRLVWHRRNTGDTKAKRLTLVPLK